MELRPLILKSIIRKEEWKELKFGNIKPDMYMISSFGRVMNIETKNILTPREINSGYNAINLRCNDNKGHNFLQHRLTAYTFIPNLDKNKNTINHKDGQKLFNDYKNLEWVTQEENNKHARENNLNNNYGSNQHMSILNEEMVHKICKLLEQSIPYKDILDCVGLDSDYSPSNNNYDLIGNIKRGISWKYISQKYNFSNSSYNGSNYTDEEIHQMCKYLERGMNFKNIYESMFNLPYTTSRNHKQYYEFIRKLKNRQHFHNITKLYKF